MEIFDALFFGIPTLCVHRNPNEQQQPVDDPFTWSDRVSSRSLEQLGIALETGTNDDETEITNKIRKLLNDKRYVLTREANLGKSAAHLRIFYFDFLII